MTFSKIRTILYSIAKYMGDFTAIKRAIKSGSIKPVVDRLLRRVYGKITGRGFNFFK